MKFSDYNIIEKPNKSVNIGDRYAKLTVLKTGVKEGTYKYYAFCRCDCGNEKWIRLDNIKDGRIVSCGCFHKEKITTHGGSNDKYFHIWAKMIRRCENINDKAYKNYGGRGISVCDEWKEYNSFKEWCENSGYKNGLTIDRIDNNGNYEPSNCRWATKKEQSLNRRNINKYEYKGKEYAISELAELANINYQTMWERITIWGWDTKKAVETKPLDKNERMKIARSYQIKRG